MTDAGRPGRKWVICLLLAAAALAVFWPALRYGFISYDDPDYVTSNPNVQHGLDWRSLHWALTTARADNWHPLTWVSHILDCQLYGLNPPGHHLTSLLLHAANSVLLFLLLNRLTGALWPGAFVAAIFALHPLRVESVVWISERKDVLSTLFWLLAVGAYARYADRLRLQLSNRKWFYALALVFFAFALMAKPMVVTLPFVLLLLDFWPLGRWPFGAPFPWRLIVEKIPFFLLAAGDSAVTFLIQNRLGAVQSLAKFPLLVRLANAPFAYLRYIAMNLWPTGLAIFYPARPVGWLAAGGAACLLVAASVLVVRRRRAQPYLAVGWFWFLGMLVPTIGLVQVGTQAMADRYTYLPSVGLWIMVAWAARDALARHAVPRALAALAAGMAILACFILTPLQERCWRDSGALYRRAADVTDHNYLAYYNLGCYVRDQGDFPQAILDFTKALKAETGDSLRSYRARTCNDLGYAYLHEGEISNAVANLDQALALQPRYPEAYYNLGRAFLAHRQPDVAVDCFQRALALQPGVPEIHCQLANALAQLGRLAPAIAEYSRALQLRPGLDEAAANLASLLATCPDRSLRDGSRAIALARQASEHSHGQNPAILGTLAAAYAETGNLSEAVATAQQARQLALAQNNLDLAGVLESQVRQYQDGRGGTHP